VITKTWSQNLWSQICGHK